MLFTWYITHNNKISCTHFKHNGYEICFQMYHTHSITVYDAVLLEPLQSNVSCIKFITLLTFSTFRTKGGRQVEIFEATTSSNSDQNSMNKNLIQLFQLGNTSKKLQSCNSSISMKKKFTLHCTNQYSILE